MLTLPGRASSVDVGTNHLKWHILPLVLDSMPTVFVEPSHISNETFPCPLFAQQNLIMRRRTRGSWRTGIIVSPNFERRSKLIHRCWKIWGWSGKQTLVPMAIWQKYLEATILELRASLLVLSRQMRYEGGRIARQTIMACVAGTGRNSNGTSLALRAASLGVRSDVFAEAQKRMQRVLHDAPPTEAIASGRYLWTRREKRNDATDSELLAMAKRVWHSDDISRATGNSGEYTLHRLRETVNTPH